MNIEIRSDILSSHTKTSKLLASCCGLLGLMSFVAEGASYGNGSANYSISTASNPNYGSTSYTASTKTAGGLQDKIDDAAAGGGGVVNMNSGTYWIGTGVNMKDKVALIGKGIDSSGLKRHSSFSHNKGSSGSATWYHIIGGLDASLNDVLLRKLWISGAYSKSGLNSNKPRIYGARFGGGGSNYNTKIRLRQIRSRYNGMGSTASGTKNLRVESCEIIDNGPDSLWHNIYYRRVGKIYVSGCDISQASVGNGFKHAGGTFSDDADESKNTRVRTSVMEDNGKNNTSVRGVYYARIEANTFDDQTSSSRQGLILAKENGYGNKYNDIINNSIRYNDGRGIRVEDANEINIEGNRVSNNGGADYSVVSSSNVDNDNN